MAPNHRQNGKGAAWGKRRLSTWNPAVWGYRLWVLIEPAFGGLPDFDLTCESMHVNP